MKNEDKLESMFSRILSRLSKQVVDVKLARATLEDGTIIDYSDDAEVGTPVSVVTINESEEEVFTPAAEGEYVDVEGNTIVVDADGNLASFTAGDETSTDDTTELSEEQVAAITSNFNVDSLMTLVDSSRDGWHNVDFSITGGVITFGEVYSSTYKSLMSKAEEVEASVEVELSKKEDEIVELQKKLDTLNKSEVKTDLKKENKKGDFTPMTFSQIKKIEFRNKLEAGREK